MNISKPRTVDEYIAFFPAELQPVLQEVRETILSALPGAEETISYDMPTFKLNGRMVIYFAGWKKHIALYPVNAALSENLSDEISKYKGSKDSIHFPLNKPMPLDLISRIVIARAQEKTDQAF